MLNLAQFLGVINDNVFKFTMAFLLIDALGKEHASIILSATGAIYVIPFLLFSSSAGILADRFSKQKLLVIMKIAEMAVMILAIFAFAAISVVSCYILLFLLATHSAMFGPSKYGIIPELVESDRVSRANGLITSFTYLAIIIGTFLASFLTEITSKRFVLIAVFCFFVAMGGFFSALRIKRTQPQGSQKKMNVFFVREIFRTLKASTQTPHLLPAIFGSAYFLFIGAFTQLNIIPFAIQSLSLSEVSGGYLFLATALGIAIGSFLAGKMSKKRIELGMSCLAGIGIALSFFLLAIFPSNLTKSIIALILIGVLGGIFIVPFDTFIQLYSNKEKRGQTIAASNFLAFFGVLIASLALYLFSQVLYLSPAGGFAVMGSITLITSCVLMACLSDLFLPYFSRHFLHRIYRFRAPSIEKIEQSSKTILILEKGTWRDALLVLGTVDRVRILVPRSTKGHHSRFYRLFNTFHLIPAEEDPMQLIAHAKKLLDRGLIPCLLLEQPFHPRSRSFFDLFRNSARLIFVRIERVNNHLTMQFSLRD